MEPHLGTTGLFLPPPIVQIELGSTAAAEPGQAGSEMMNYRIIINSGQRRFRSFIPAHETAMEWESRTLLTVRDSGTDTAVTLNPMVKVPPQSCDRS